MQYTTAQPYAASYVLLRQHGKIAFLLRENTGWMNGYYCIAPSGKVEVGESFTQAAIREAREETGIFLTPENLKQVFVCHRKSEGEKDSWVDVWFEATGWEGEVINAESTTHSELRWFDPADLPENVIPVHRFMLEQVLSGESYCEYNWD